MPKIKSTHITVTDIEWDIDKADIEEYGFKPNLPNEVEIPMNAIPDAISDNPSNTYADAISDYLSDTYAYTVKGFLIRKGAQSYLVLFGLNRTKQLETFVACND